MNYVGYINQLMCEKLKQTPDTVCFGQNISTGSCLSGLTRGLPEGDGKLVVNTTNSECTLTGAGFGLLAEGMNAVFFLKQQDFLLLGIDHLVHTWNAMRAQGFKGSFTIMAIVVDNGYEGPQSCLNNLADFCSISKIPGYSLSNKEDIDAIIKDQFLEAGVRFIAVSQSLFRSEMGLFEDGGEAVDPANHIRKYGAGKDVTIVSLNFAFSQAQELYGNLQADQIDGSLFNVSSMMPDSWGRIFQHAAQSKRVVICDDSKSVHKQSAHLASLIKAHVEGCDVLVLDRSYQEEWSFPNADQFVIEPVVVKKWHRA